MNCDVCGLTKLPEGETRCRRCRLPVHAMGVERRISGVTVCCSSATRRSVQVSFRGTTHTRAVTCRKCIGLLQEMAQREDAQKERLRDRALLGGPKDWKGHSTL